MKKKLVLRHEQAAHYLETQWHAVLPGARFAPLRELCAASGVKRSIMETELARMAQAGKIRIVPRGGIYKTRQTDGGRKVWLFASLSQLAAVSGFGRELLDTLREEARRHGYEFAPVEFNFELLLEWTDFMKRHQVKELFLWCNAHEWFSRIAARTASHVIEILPRYTPRDCFAVIDSPEMSRIQLEYLFQLGHRRVGCIHNAEPPPESSPVQHARLADYYRIMAEHGLPVYPEWVFSGYCGDESFRDRFQRMTTGKHPVSAVVTAGGFLERLCRTAREQLVEPGRDLSIMSSDAIAGVTEEEITTVTNSPGEIARTAWRLLEASRNGELPRVERSRLRIHIGRSVVRVAGSGQG